MLKNTLSLACLVFSLTTNAASQYIITNLGTLGGNKSYGYGLNNQGQVVGYSTDSSGQEYGYIWQNGVMTNINTWNASVGSITRAVSINDNGVIVGRRNYSSSQSTAIYAQNGSISNIAYSDYAMDVNNNNEVLYMNSGWAQVLNVDSGVIRSMGSNTFRTAINDQGDTVGSGVLQDRNLVYTQLGNLGAGGTYAQDVNNLGQVVGNSNYAPGFQHAFIWDSVNGMSDLETLGGSIGAAKGINEKGQVVGWSSDAAGIYRATLWDEQGNALDLGSLVIDMSGWSYLQLADAINDQGQIVGNGITSDGETHAFLLTAVVPVPAAAWFFGSALVGLAGIKRKK